MTELGDVVRTLGSLPFTSLKTPEQIAAGEARLRQLAGKLDSSSPLALMFGYAIRDLEIQKLRSQKAPEAEIRAKVESLVEFLTANKDKGVFVLYGQNHLDRYLRKYGIAK